MKRSKVLALSMLAIMLLATLPVQQSKAASPYSEKLNVFIAGSSAYWYFSFTGINGSSKLSRFEGSPGLGWYNVTAITTTNWKSDFQIFGPEGYNLLPVPFAPSQGLFLTLGSDSYSDALAAAGRLDSYFTAAFVSVSNGSSSFEFYSPISFAEIVPSTLLKLVPSTMGGFAAAISSSNFTSTLSPFVILEGTKGSSGFSHSLVIGSISDAALDSQKRPNLFQYFGTSVTSLAAANESSSSTIRIRALDGVVELIKSSKGTKDNATVTNDFSNFSGSYTLTVAASKKVHGINATVLQQPLQLLAVRSVDVGVLQKGQNMTVAITLTNLSNQTALENITVNDHWWSPSLFRLVRGNSTYSAPALSASNSATATYVLQYIGNVTERVTIPAEAVHFAYKLGESTFTGDSWLNPITISLGRDDAVILAYVTPNGSESQPVGAAQSLSLFVRNVGTRTASSVVADGQQVGGLLPDGGNHTVTISQTANGLLGTNVTKAYLVTYFGVQGNQLNSTTNLLPIEFSHSGMQLGFATVVLSANLSPLKAGSTAINLTLGFTVTNAGSASISRFKADLQLPPGLGCGVTHGTEISCVSNLLSLHYTLIAAQATEETSMMIKVSTPANYFIPPLSFQGTTAVINFSGRSNALAVPTGYVLTKRFNPTLLFSGVSSTVTLSALNTGPFYIYNASVDSTVDAFDSLSPLAVPSIGNGSISPHDNLTRTYVVTASNVYGNRSASLITSRIFFGGMEFSIEGLGPHVSVLQPLNLTITTTPSVPTEGKDFHLDLTIQNPSAVNVSSVLLTMPVPSGLTISDLSNAKISNGVLTASTPLLSSGSEFTATGMAVASSGNTLSFAKARLVFVYGGLTINGTVSPKSEVTIAENVTTRYLIPIGIALVALVATAIFVRRLAAPSVPASRK
jgi:hypothetical protein